MDAWSGLREMSETMGSWRSGRSRTSMRKKTMSLASRIEMEIITALQALFVHSHMDYFGCAACRRCTTNNSSSGGRRKPQDVKLRHKTRLPWKSTCFGVNRAWHVCCCSLMTSAPCCLTKHCRFGKVTLCLNGRGERPRCFECLPRARMAIQWMQRRPGT